MKTYYKAVRPDGTDFHSGTVAWLPADGLIPPEGWLVTHPTAKRLGPEADAYLSAATVATDCTGIKWPCRLLRLEPAGRAVRRADDNYPHQRCSLVWRVVEELPAHEALGPQGTEVAAIIERTPRLTPDEVQALHAALDAARGAAWYAARDAAGYASLDAAREAAWYDARPDAWEVEWYAAQDAVRATLVRDLIRPEHYNTLMAPWLSVIGGGND